METTKENDQPQLLSQLQITLPSTSVEKPNVLPGNDGTLIKSEVFENANDLQAFSSNMCNISLPFSSASARIAQMIRTEPFNVSAYSGGKRKNKTNGLFPFQQEVSLQEDNKQCEVLKAAKSLFSKRTRTLYHWMYPNASKQQLKSAIKNSWETLSHEEKEFYISQVLGRFGFPQRSLMVNPQLNCMNSLVKLPLDFQTSEETRNAVSSILNENNKPRGLEAVEDGSFAKKRKLCRPPTAGGRRGRGKRGDMNSNKVVQEVDEFQDDPELSREFQQFKWALGMTSNDGK